MKQKFNVGVAPQGDPNQKSHIALPTSQQGITLIALVITIIVLLILAGVTINMVLGENGIIGQAQNAKKAQDKARVDEDDAIAVAQGNVDLYTEGTVANKVKVGDYVAYKYDAPEEAYKITAEESGMQEVADLTGDQTIAVEQNLSSGEGENAQVTKWRVLSAKDGIVKLISEEPVGSLSLGGKNGYLYGAEKLNEMCRALYSKEGYGTGRSIKVEDINERTGYDGTKKYWNNNSDEVTIPANERKTIGDLEGDETLGLNALTNRHTPDGKAIEDYEVNYYGYNVLNGIYNNKKLTGESDEYKMLFRKKDNSNYMPTYWLASPCVFADFSSGCAYFDVRYVGSGFVGAYDLLRSFGYPDGDSFAVRPVVTLKSGLQVDGGTGTSENAWKIKGL